MVSMMARDPETPLLARRPYSRQRPRTQYSRRKLEILFWILAILLTSVMLLHEALWRIQLETLLFLA